MNTYLVIATNLDTHRNVRRTVQAPSAEEAVRKVRETRGKRLLPSMVTKLEG